MRQPNYYHPRNTDLTLTILRILLLLPRGWVAAKLLRRQHHELHDKIHLLEKSIFSGKYFFFQTLLQGLVNVLNAATFAEEDY
jgi:hypothetical protein